MLVLSEFHPDAPWSVGRAMQRNTMICALGRAMFVIEAGATGGTLAAGRTAMRLGRPLYAIRYPDASAGNEILLHEGACALTRDSDLRAAINKHMA
jgi:DNA processing protein